MVGIEERRSWDVRFIRRPNDWEIGGVDAFLCTLGSNLLPTENGIVCDGSYRRMGILISDRFRTFGGSKIGGRLRTWKVPMISYWLFLVAPFLIGLGIGNSPLVTLSLHSLAPFFVISIFSFCFLSSFSVIFFSALCFSA